MSKNTKPTTAHKPPKTRCVPSVATAKPANRPTAANAPTPAVDAPVAIPPSDPDHLADVLAKASDVKDALTTVENAIQTLNDALTDYRGTVIDDRRWIHSSDFGRTDLEITARTAEVATTTTAMLLHLLAEREARVMGLRFDDLLLLSELADKTQRAYTANLRIVLDRIDADAA